MTIKYVGNFTEAMKAYSEEKLERIKRHGGFNEVVVRVKVVGDDTTVEVSADNRVRAKHTGEDFYAVLNLTIDKIISQIERYKRFKRTSPNVDSTEETEDYTDVQIAREKIVFTEEMTVYEAIETMNLLDHSFFIYKDIDNANATSVVYRRNDGTYGILISK